MDDDFQTGGTPVPALDGPAARFNAAADDRQAEAGTAGAAVSRIIKP